MSVSYPHWNPFCFCFYPFIAPLPLSSTLWRAASQSKAQKKLQPLTQVPVLQEQGEYCTGAGGVWTWVPAVWSSVWGRGGTGASSFPFHAFVLSFNIHLSAHLQGWLERQHSSHPPLTVTERSPTHRADTRPKMWWWEGLSLVCVWASVFGLQRSVRLCACILCCINTYTLQTLWSLPSYKSWSVLQSVTDPQREESH